MNLLVRPFVSEMLKLWDGVIMKTHDGFSVLVRAALLCCACDISGARKICGFVGHSGTKGCSRCLLSFTKDRFGSKADYTKISGHFIHCRPIKLHQQPIKKLNQKLKGKK